MKKFYYTIVAFFNKIIAGSNTGLQSANSIFIFSRFKVEKKNLLVFNNCKITRSNFYIKGNANEVRINADHITNCNFSILGTNNKVIIESGVGISKGIVILKGNNCLIKIGEYTTFGGVRVVNMGNNNALEIGRRCLFSDNIEIWASDTHSIYDEEGTFINREKPISIEDEVWVGSNVTILKGVVIGKGAVVGMSSVVTKSINAYTINVGNPAKSIKTGIRWTLKYHNFDDL